MTLPKRECYTCGAAVLPMHGSGGLCDGCAAAAKGRATTEPSTTLCKGCGYRFINDWERQKHELIGNHKYRAWRGNDAHT
jgi:NMD protein affecting ribosome stability and mRNA decay